MAHKLTQERKCPGELRLFGLLLLTQRFNFSSLLLQLRVLRCNLMLHMAFCNLAVLDFVPDQTASQRTNATADSCSGPWMTHCGPDDRSGSSAEHSAGQRSLLSGC